MSEQNNAQQRMPVRRPGGPGPAFARPVEKAKNFKGSFVRLVKYLSPFKVRLLVVFFTAIVSTVFAIEGPKVTGDGFNQIAEAFETNGKFDVSKVFHFQIDYHSLWWNTIMVLLGLYVFSSVFAYIQQYLMATVSQRTVYRMRHDVNSKLTRLPLKYFDSKTHGEILSRITNDIDMIATTLSQSLTSIITSIVTVIGITIMMFTISWQLTLIVLATLPVSVAISIPIIKAAQKFFKGQQDALGEISGHVEEMYTGHKIVKAFGREQESIKTFNDINEKLYKSGWKAQFITGIIMPIMQFVNNLGYVFVTIAGVSLVIKGKLQIGYINTFISYTRQFSQPISQIASISNTLQLAVAAAERVFELLDEQEMEPETTTPTVALTDKGFVVPKEQFKLSNNAKFVHTDKGIALVDKQLDERVEYVQADAVSKDEVIGKLADVPANQPRKKLAFSTIETDLGSVIPNQAFNLDYQAKLVNTNKGLAVLDEAAVLDFKYAEATEENREKVYGKLVSYPKGYVTFDDVDFRYKEDAPLIDNMHIEVRPGQVIAIVGPTGAGKTTIVNLLMRFYEVNRGSISIDGVNIRDMARDDLRHIFGMVLQDTWMFNGTIRDNIAYGKMDATDEEIIEAAKAAEADHFIRTLPEGYNTVLNEEASNISQGQRQLLTIARALLANPSILILDEATSSVDTRTEIHIQNAMTKLMKGRTNFVIAHRLSTIKNADMILVMNHGHIIEQGNHEELMAKNGFYADLYNSQFTNKNIVA